MKPLRDWDTRTTVLNWPFLVRMAFILGTLIATQAIVVFIGIIKREPYTSLRLLALIISHIPLIGLCVVWAITTASEIDHQLRQRWLPFDGNVNDGEIIGVVVEGDPKARPITWLNQFFIKYFWNRVAVLEIDPEPTADQLGEEDLEWRIGFKPEPGNAKLKVQVLTAKRVRVRLGRDDCRFFAIGLDEKEIPLMLVDTTTIDDTRYANVPLH